MIAGASNAKTFDSDDCPRATVIRRILATTPKITECEITVPGISTGLWTHFAAYFDFGNGRLLPIPVFDSPDHLKLVDENYIQTLSPYETFDPDPELLAECVGACIDDVLTNSMQEPVFFRISNGTMVWMEIEVNGYSLRCEKISEFDGVRYWNLNELNSILN